MVPLDSSVGDRCDGGPREAPVEHPEHGAEPAPGFAAVDGEGDEPDPERDGEQAGEVELGRRGC